MRILHFAPRYFIVSIFLFMCIAYLHGQGIRTNFCGESDLCENAILIDHVVTDSAIICGDGCNLFAQPDTFYKRCGLDTFPTVWYKFNSDAKANSVKIHLASAEFDSPTLGIFLHTTDCSTLKPVFVKALNGSCDVGVNGVVEIDNIRIKPNSSYYIAVSSNHSAGGQFQLCLNTFYDETICFISTDLTITNRSFGGSLEGPFLPTETVSVCMNVNSFSAFEASCVWFQGLIPSFGDGWDHSSFDAFGQPISATINNLPMGQDSNGVYLASRWDWFTDIGYHHNNPNLQIGDFDGNGTIEMCQFPYEDCPMSGGITGGCCPPCWEFSGQQLPPGWFAYGINGTCSVKGHPTKDWGDGNTCGTGMGPWSFCYDLQVKSFPDCLSNNPLSDLKLAFHQTTDSETGATIGGLSNCVNDRPQIRNFHCDCGTEIEYEQLTLPGICSGESVSYFLSHPEVIHWYWTLEPFGSANALKGEENNESAVTQQIINTSSQTISVTYHFKGALDSIGSYISRDVTFDVYPQISFLSPDTIHVCYYDSRPFFVNASPAGGTVPFTYLWTPGGITTPAFQLVQPFYDQLLTVFVTDENGCINSKNIYVSVDTNCLTGIIDPVYDESNEDPLPGDPIILPGDIIDQALEKRSIHNNEAIHVYPIPSSDKIIIESRLLLNRVEYLLILDLNQSKILDKKVSTDLTNSIEVDISDFASGVYFVVLQTKQNAYYARFIRL